MLMYTILLTTLQRRFHPTEASQLVLNLIIVNDKGGKCVTPIESKNRRDFKKRLRLG